VIESLPADWREVLGDWLATHDLKTIERFVAAERKSGGIYPPDEQVFEALRRTPFKRVRAVILGQDP
jgi:uracil-DNA glycosylase